MQEIYNIDIFLSAAKFTLNSGPRKVHNGYIRRPNFFLYMHSRCKAFVEYSRLRSV